MLNFSAFKGIVAILIGITIAGLIIHSGYLFLGYLADAITWILVFFWSQQTEEFRIEERINRYCNYK